jgi:hypothetical protein
MNTAEINAAWMNNRLLTSRVAAGYRIATDGLARQANSNPVKICGRRNVL